LDGYFNFPISEDICSKLRNYFVKNKSQYPELWNENGKSKKYHEYTDAATYDIEAARSEIPYQSFVDIEEDLPDSYKIDLRTKLFKDFEDIKKE